MDSATIPAPDMARTDAGLILISYWTVKSADLQQHAADLAMKLWKDVPWPDGMLSHHVYGADDGITVMNYSQWCDDAAFDAYLAGGQPERVRRIEEDSAGISRDAIDRFRLYRTMDGTSKGELPGCLVLVTFDVDGPEQQCQLIETLISTAKSIPSSRQDVGKSGDISSHFHVNQGGTQVVNAAEFVDAQSHERLVQSELQTDSAIANMEGVTPRGFRRFVLLASA